MSDQNLLITSGRLTRDPEVQLSKSGNSFVVFGIAVNNFAKGAKDTTFWNCMAFGDTAEQIAEKLRKGDWLMFEGRVTMDKWTDKGGGKREQHKFIVNRYLFPPRNTKAEGDDQATDNSEEVDYDKRCYGEPGGDTIF
jgi:single-strand DNA-binding protein